ncbi:MAG: SDR family NAD(P)-dependent oxidoreductase [Nakamurella sp.]
MDTANSSTENGAVLIVGAGPRLGAALARAIGAGTRRVGLIARSTNTIEELATSLRTEGISAFGEAVDVSDAAELTDAIDRLSGQTGPFDVAIHNVSVWREAGVGTLTAEDLLADVAAGAASLVTIVNAVAPGMMQRGAGTIITTGSGAADEPTAGAPSLAVQKAALRVLTRGYAAELKDIGVHCATVTITGALDSPGFAVADIADVYASLVRETTNPREKWRTVVDFTGAH